MMAADAGAGEPARLKRFRDAHERFLVAWQSLLSNPVPEPALVQAFGDLLDEYPEARDRICGPDAGVGMVGVAVARLFPKLSTMAPEIVPRMIHDFLGLVAGRTKEEFELIVEERQLRSKFNELEQLVAEARTKGKDARPAPLDMMPEDEIRSLAMEIKLEYEKQLVKQLDVLRRENQSLEGEVAAVDSRARVIKANVDQTVASLNSAADLAAKAMESMSLDDADVAEQ